MHWTLNDIKKQSEAGQERILKALKVAEQSRNNRLNTLSTDDKKKRNKSHLNGFDSLAESLFYEYLLTLPNIKKIHLHKEFPLLDDIKDPSLFLGKRTKISVSKKRYTLDFLVEMEDGRMLAIETKGKTVKKLQRDFSLRIHLFLEKYVIPNQWKFAIVPSEYITSNEYYEEYQEVLKEIESFIHE